jgi:hypothetical protein
VPSYDIDIGIRVRLRIVPSYDMTYRWQVLGLAHKELRVKIWQ